MIGRATKHPAFPNHHSLSTKHPSRNVTGLISDKLTHDSYTEAPCFYITELGTMGTEAMKLELIEWLAQLKDPGMVTSLFNLKKANEAKDWYVELNPEQKASIDRGLADAAAGRVVTSEEMGKHYGHVKKG